MYWQSARSSRGRSISGRSITSGHPLPMTTVKLRRMAAYRGIRVLSWDGNVLYSCRRYEVVRLTQNRTWEQVAKFEPVWWRSITARANLSHRLVRDGFHALAVLGDGTMIGAV